MRQDLETFCGKMSKLLENLDNSCVSEMWLLLPTFLKECQNLNQKTDKIISNFVNFFLDQVKDI